MAVGLFDAARFICERGGWQVTNLKLQKILYMAHMVHRGRTGEPLVRSRFEAWDYGPVAPELYHHVRAFGAKAIPNVFHFGNPVDGTREGHILSEACDNLLSKTPAELVSITHWDRGAWAKNYIAGAKGVVISDADIAEEYRKRVGQ